MIPEKSTLSNGIRVVLTPMEATEAVTAIVFAKAGSRCEDEKTNGLAHFQEHMFFKGGKKYNSAEAVAKAVDNIGAEINGGTSRQEVAYHIQCAGSQVEKAIDILSDMIINAPFDLAEINKERSVIIQEIKRKLDNPGSQIWTDWQEIFFGNQPLGRAILGPVANIERFTKKNFVEYHSRFYANGNIVISIAGKISSPHNTRLLLEKYFASKPKKRAYEWKCFDKKLCAKPGTVSIRTQDTQQAHLILGFPSMHAKHELSSASRILSIVLGGSMSSRLFLRIRGQQGLCYTVGIHNDRAVDAGFFATYAGVSPDKIEQAVKSILREFEKVLQKGITKKELKKGKNMLEGRFALGLEDSPSVAEFFGNQELFYRKIETPRQVLDKIQAVTLEDVKRAADMIFSRKAVLTIIGPVDDKKRFQKLL